MKKLFAIAILASAFTFTSCGGGSLADKVASCTCETVNAAVKLKKEVDAAPEDKKAELQAKAAEAMKAEPACMKGLEAEAKKVPEADQAKMQTELKAAIEKKCGAAMKELGMPGM
jgi:Skp family chaperone for outer membrane proteins